jgi:hypothetical protein
MSHAGKKLRGTPLGVSRLCMLANHAVLGLVGGRGAIPLCCIITLKLIKNCLEANPCPWRGVLFGGVLGLPWPYVLLHCSCNDGNEVERGRVPLVGCSGCDCHLLQHGQLYRHPLARIDSIRLCHALALLVYVLTSHLVAGSYGCFLPTVFDGGYISRPVPLFQGSLSQYMVLELTYTVLRSKAPPTNPSTEALNISYPESP